MWLSMNHSLFPNLGYTVGVAVAHTYTKTPWHRIRLNKRPLEEETQARYIKYSHIPTVSKRQGCHNAEETERKATLFIYTSLKLGSVGTKKDFLTTTNWVFFKR